MAVRKGHQVLVSELPACDLCGQPAHYDAKTHWGPWAYLCVEHFGSETAGKTGVGVGQELVLRDEQ